MESSLSRKVEMVVDLQFNLHYTFITTFTRLMLDGRWEGHGLGHGCLFFLLQISYRMEFQTCKPGSECQKDPEANLGGKPTAE